jgi:competence protein ComEA
MNRTKQAALSILFALGWTVALAGPVDVNTADAETISAELRGIGLSRAAAIVEYRKQNGPFRSVDDLLEVKGIGERTLEINENNIVIARPKKKSGK